MSKSPCWSKLRERSTLLTNEQCLLDLDERLAALEARDGAAAAPAALPAAVEQPAHPAGESLLDAAPAGPDFEQHVPIPVAQRLPELHELDGEGRCWAFRSASHEPHGKAWILGTPVSLQLTRPWCSFSHWLPYWALPIVEEPAAPSGA